MPSEIEAISPFVDSLMRLIEESQCVRGKEQDVESALREALGNAVVHGNQEDARKKVHIRCRCRWRGALLISVRDEGNGFAAKEAQRISAGNRYSEHGRGIQLMKAYMDGVRYSRGGSEVQMHKRARSVH
jgi:serine/threonine-protein kinase RsbW